MTSPGMKTVRRIAATIKECADEVERFLEMDKVLRDSDSPEEVTATFDYRMTENVGVTLHDIKRMVVYQRLLENKELVAEVEAGGASAYIKMLDGAAEAANWFILGAAMARIRARKTRHVQSAN